MVSSEPQGPGMSADEVMQRLIGGNERFLRGETRFPRYQKDILVNLAKGQKPYAPILGCSDSRVPPELIFDAGKRLRVRSASQAGKLNSSAPSTKSRLAASGF